MQGYFGSKDCSGDWFIILDTDKCNACGECVKVCPEKILEIGHDEFDPFRENPVARIREEDYKKIRYSCAPCKPGFGDKPAPCAAACAAKAITHSDGWKNLYGHKRTPT